MSKVIKSLLKDLIVEQFVSCGEYLFQREIPEFLINSLARLVLTFGILSWLAPLVKYLWKSPFSELKVSKTVGNVPFLYLNINISTVKV